MQPRACCPKAERAPSHESSNDQQVHRFIDNRTPQPRTGVRPARPLERASRAFSFVGGTGRNARHLTTRKLPRRLWTGQPTILLVAVSKRIHARRHVSSVVTWGRRQDQLGRSTRQYAVLRTHEHGRAEQRVIMMDGVGGIFRYPAVGLFQEVGSWEVGCRC